MDNSIIYIFLILANIVAMAATYFSFGKRLSNDKKMMYSMITIGIIYIITLIVYFFSSIGIQNDKVSQSSRNMVTFSFVPVNTIILLPFLIHSFTKAKDKEIKTESLNKRVAIVAIIAVILIITEFFYFRNIQNNIIELGEQMKSETTTQNQ